MIYEIDSPLRLTDRLPITGQLGLYADYPMDKEGL